jgi:hypothetical protein
MDEDAVNVKVKEWLEESGYKYKGVLRKPLRDDVHPWTTDNRSTGHIPVLTGDRDVLIDHQGIDYDSDPVRVMWVESKGIVKISVALEGFIRVLGAVFYGGGDGLLAVPGRLHDYLMDEWGDFLSATAEAAVGKGRIGIFDADKKKVSWLNEEE